MGNKMKRLLLTISDEMHQELDRERQERKVENIQEAIRQILSDYMRKREQQ